MVRPTYAEEVQHPRCSCHEPGGLLATERKQATGLAVYNYGIQDTSNTVIDEHRAKAKAAGWRMTVVIGATDTGLAFSQAVDNVMVFWRLTPKITQYLASLAKTIELYDMCSGCKGCRWKTKAKKKARRKKCSRFALVVIDVK